MTKGRVYLDGEFLTEITPFKFEGPTYTIISHDIVDYPVLIKSAEGERFGTLTGRVWRVCTETECFTSIFPSKEAADIFVTHTMFLGGRIK